MCYRALLKPQMDNQRPIKPEQALVINNISQDDLHILPTTVAVGQHHAINSSRSASE